MFKHLNTLSIAGLALASAASALPINFVYNGATWGTMDLTVANASTVQVSFTAAGSVPGYTDFQVTGFAFAVTEGLSLSISNPGSGAFATDDDNLTWIDLTNMSAIPTSANTGIQKEVWDVGVTEGQNNGYNPPGVHPGMSDIFYLSGFSGLVNDASISANISLEGIRIQAIEPGGGSLFLTGSDPVAVPEPGTLALMGLGLAGVAVAGLRRKK